MRETPKKLSYANVMATIAVFLALTGGAFAATKIGKNAVKTKNIANGAVTQQKIKAPVKYSNVTGFTNGWASGSVTGTAQFGKDALGIVHLRGTILNGTDNSPAFTLPSGFRPPGAGVTFATISGFSVKCEVGVEPNGEVTSTGCNNLFVALSAVSFSS
jgi:hypothetical protein